MGKLKFTFTNILLLVGVFASVLLFENLSFFAPNEANPLMTLGMDNSYFFLTFAIAIVSFASVITIESVHNKAGLNLKILIPVSIFFVSILVGVLTLDLVTFQTELPVPDLVIDGWNKTRHVLTLLCYALCVYCLFTYFNKNNPSLNRLKYLLIAVVVFVLAITVYSVIAEYSVYEFIATQPILDPQKFSGIKSIFMNSNMYSGMILMGVSAAIVLNYFKKNPLSYIAIIGLTIIQIFVNSVAGVIITLVLVTVYFAFEIVNDFLKKKKRAFLFLGLYLSVLVTLVILFCLCQSFEVPVLSNFVRFLYGALSKSDYKSFTQRTITWGATTNYLVQNPTRLIFGVGINNSNRIVGGLVYDTHHSVIKNYSLSTHNGFIQLFLDFGLIGLLAYAAFVFYYFYALIKLMKNHTRFSLIFLLIGMCYFGYAISESMIAFLPSAQGILIGALFYLPVINKYHHLKHTEVVKDVIDNAPEIYMLNPERTVKAVSRVCLSIFLASFSLIFVYQHLGNSVTLNATLMMIFTSLLVYLLFPYLCGLFAQKNDWKSFAINLLINAAIFLAPIVILIPLMSIPSINLMPGYEWMVFAIEVVFTIGMVAFNTYKHKGTFNLYLNTFKACKLCLGSISCVLASYIILASTNQYLIAFSPLTVILLIAYMIVTFYASSFVVPFKETIELVSYMNTFDFFYLKKNIIRDRLEEPYEV